MRAGILGLSLKNEDLAFLQDPQPDQKGQQQLLRLLLKPPLQLLLLNEIWTLVK
jgi:hypothetical protein